MIPKITHTVWLGGNMPKEFNANYEITFELMPTWQHYLWTESNAYEFGLQPYQWEHATAAGSSNIIRLWAVLKMGGIYRDCDVKPILPFDCLLPHKAFAVRQSSPKVTCNAFFGAEPNHPWIKAQIDSYGDQRKYDAAHGCYKMEECLTPDVEILPTHSVYSWNWDSPISEQRIHPDAIAVHTWNKSWVKK